MTTKIFPWVECNSPDHVPNVVAGLPGWLGATDTTIVTTTPGNSSLYSSICEQVPRMRIVPGLKTHPLLEGDFASPEGWQAIRNEVVETVWRTRTHTFVFENENAMRPVWEGTQECDLDRLEASIKAAKFPTNVTYICYPSVGAWSPKQQKIAVDVCKTIQGCLNVVFVDSATLSGPASLTWGANLRVAETLKDLSLIPILYCYGEGSKWWMDENLPEALAYIKEGPAILYPGYDRWVEASQEIPRTLIDANLIPRVL